MDRFQKESLVFFTVYQSKKDDVCVQQSDQACSAVRIFVLYKRYNFMSF